MSFDKLLGIHAQALQLHAKRAEVLAGNIANADTPGYKARDFDFHEVLRQQVAGESTLTTTHQRHIPLDDGVISPSEMAYRIPTQPSLDGNTVDSQLEHTAFAENALQYQASLRFLGGTIQTLKKAITGQ
ncbi:flagellar basal body rod protein FlgB [Sedimenticola thiotaurini]|uniref:Flagellar basal body rod protein FlgB n=1 Tax=Sedimenticola thiotaurini TaxID=1543721 RepID=A0A0F7JXC3_9GAMM|nr:flagellar basal body rod protein FlgB [Sedimenticola thiotaurini]AKH20282.1 flagellar basal body rod protein FlgB [Sedimenticola thiotaurini]